MGRIVKDEPTHQPTRVIAGHCPKCGEVMVVFNNYEVWPYLKCSCGWQGATTEIDNHVRLERGSVIRVEGS